MTTATAPPRFVPPRRFDNGAEWLRAFGGVPLERIIFDPWPGTATEADLLLFVERDKRLCELIDGTLVEKPVGYWEGVIAQELGRHLGNHVRPLELGAVSGADSTMRMTSGRVRLPDVGFTSRDRLPKTLDPIPTLAPDLAVEVLSESNTKDEIDQKLQEYFQSGTRLAWIIDPPTRTVAVYHRPGEPTRVLAESETMDGEHVLPGFALPIAELFVNVPR
jgi:Uma2 family endonuclease